MMVNSPDCCTSLYSSQLTLALTLCANSELSPIMSPMHYSNYITLHRIWVHIYCIGTDSDDSTDSIISVTLILLVEATSLTNNNRHGFKVLPVTLNTTDWRWQLSRTLGKIRLVAESPVNIRHQMFISCFVTDRLLFVCYIHRLLLQVTAVTDSVM